MTGSSGSTALPSRVQVKICGITRTEDARAAEAEGAAYIGAVLVPGSPRRVDPDRAATLADAVSIPLVLVTADLSAQETAEAARRAGAGVLQLHGDESEGTVERLRDLGEWELWKAVRVRSGGEIDTAVARFGSVADLLLLDGWHPSHLGGTGTSFPWGELEAVRDGLPDDLRLGAAGGLEAGNVGEALRRLRPHLVDVSSGVEARPGLKDPARIRAFLAAVRKSAASVRGDP